MLALSLAIDEADNTASLDVALSVAGHFGLKKDLALKIAAEVGGVVKTWGREAAALGLTSEEVDRMASAFEHHDLETAISLAT